MKQAQRPLRLILPLATVSLLVVLAITSIAVISLRRLHTSTSGFTLGQSATAMANLARTVFRTLQINPELGKSQAGQFCKDLAAGTSIRISLIGRDGWVLGDSHGDPAGMDNHALRPEVAEALAGRSSTQLRRSATLGSELYYIAIPVRLDSGIVGVLRLALEVPELARQLRPFYLSAGLSALLIALAAVYANYRLAARLTRPVRSLLAAARAWSAGELDYRLPEITYSELSILPSAMNSMAGELKQRIVGMEEARNELSVLLDCMAEAVIAVDSELRVRLMNAEAATLFGHTRDSLPQLNSQSLLQATGQTALDEIARCCIDGGDTVEDEFVLYGDTTRTFMVYASRVVRNGSASGVVMVLNDITRLKQLETIRRDFVANVSHELRTPITLIKGFVETLEAGAIGNMEDARRFLDIINRNTDRMSAVIQDLLMLAQLESPGRTQLETGTIEVWRLFQSASAMVVDKARGRGMLIQTTCDRALEMQGNEGLLEQALINLLDNAVKYGRERSSIQLKAYPSGDEMVLEVEDCGIGIPARAQPRIFERFYRVDQARSRAMGGTGLGLAIVRHIALAHGGRVSLESSEGKGSIFRMHLPAQGEAQSAG